MATKTVYRAALVAVFLLVAVAAEPALAFSPPARAEIARRSLTLMPDGLERQLRKHARPLFAGSLAGLAERGSTDVAALTPGEADAKLDAAIERAVRLIEERRPMSEVATAFGEIARIASDLSFALYVGESDPREDAIRREFALYIERKLPRMSVTFSGYVDPHLARGDVRAFAAAAAEGARRDYDSILRSYYPEGRERLPQDFDDRSVAFAAASLGVSLAVTTTAKAWLYVWHKANGDMTGAALLPSAARARPFHPRIVPEDQAHASHEDRSTP